MCVRIAFLAFVFSLASSQAAPIPPPKVQEDANGAMIIWESGWPQGERLPKWFVVKAAQAKLWGSPDLENEMATVRVSFENQSDQEVNVLNVGFWDSRFVVTALNGRRRSIPIKLEDTEYPHITPQMIIAPKSRVSFDVQFRHPSKAVLGARATFRSEATLRFLLRDYLDQGKHQSATYDVPFSVVDAPH